jgi:hypothetical protein
LCRLNLGFELVDSFSLLVFFATDMLLPTVAFFVDVAIIHLVSQISYALRLEYPIY